jgi:tetratricopeptide (TPR) repeat protein
MNVQQTAQLSRQDLLMAARAVLIRAREINPLNTDHSANLARLYRRWADLSTDPAQKTKQIELSSQHYVQATDLSPHNAILWNEWATVEMMRGSLDGAEQKLAQSLKLDTRFDQTYMILGELYVNTKNYDRAIEAYQNALEINPNLLQAQGTLAYVYAQQGKLAEAIAANQTLIKLAPSDPSVWNTYKNLAILYAQAGDLQAALAQAQIAARTAPTSPTDYRAELNNYAAQLRAQLAAPTVLTTTVPVTK